MGHRTPLYDAHLAAGAKMVDFGGWDMPIHYGSQLEEHHAVRQGAGMFDVSHMTVVDVAGNDSRAYLRHLLANDIDKVPAGRALYTCMLNERGGVVDDLIVYKGADQFRLVVNCATRDKDLDWMEGQAGGYAVDIRERPDLAMIAVQGPEARAILEQQLCDTAGEAVRDMPFFGFETVGEWLIARTGYTGEDGAEIILPGGKAPELWQRLLDAGVRPIGLGARDTLRLEAGLNLYGNDMDEGITPGKPTWAGPSPWTTPSGTSSAAAPWNGTRNRTIRSCAAWCSRTKACCAPTRPCTRRTAKARPPAAPSRPPWARPLPWRACPPAPPAPWRWRYAKTAARPGGAPAVCQERKSGL